MSQRRKRSAAITLVLAGTLAGCGEPVPQRDVYTSLDHCRRDWGPQETCEPVRDSRFSNSWFYGPAYFGENWPSGRPKSSASAVDAIPVQQPSRLASAPSSYWSHNSRSTTSSSSFSRSSGSSSSSSSVSRGGFGSSASSSSS